MGWIACLRNTVLGLAAISGAVGLATAASPINSPYQAGAESDNTLFAAFAGRSPKYLDPAQSYSADETTFTYIIYEPLYGYDYLKRPYVLTPRGAAEVVQPRYVDAQGQPLPDDAPGASIAQSIYDIPIRPGMRFQPHPAFARKADGSDVYFPLGPKALDDIVGIPDFAQTGTRALTADDYVYGIKRLASPRLASPIYSLMADYIVGMDAYGAELKKVDAQLRAGRQPGDRDLPWLDFRQFALPGIQALDAHTLRIRIKGKYPQFKYWLAMTFVAPIPWEADRFYSQLGMAARDLSFNTWPVGTGPYMLSESIQNRRHVMVRNPNFHGEAYPCEGAPGDAAAGLLADCGKPTPFIDRAVFSLEKEAIPLSGKFLQGYYDVPQLDRGEYGVSMRVAASDSPQKASLYQDRGIALPTTVETSNWYMGFNWKDPVVGRGDTPAQEAKNRKLRQAISIAFNWEEFVAVFENSQAEVAHGPVPPGVLGYQPPPAGMNRAVYDDVGGRPQRKSLDEARRLLAEAGYPSGRETKTGAPLVLHYDSMVGAGADPRFDWMRRQLSRIGVQLDVRATDYNRFQDKMRRGSAQLFLWGWKADYPDAENFLFLLYGPNAKADHGGENASNYANPAFDKLFDSMKTLDDGPEKERLIAEMVTLVQNDAAWMFGYFPFSGGAYHQWVGNAKPTQMVRNLLQYMKIDPVLRDAKIREWNSPVWWPLIVLALLIALAIWPAYVTYRKAARRTVFGAAARRATKDCA